MSEFWLISAPGDKVNLQALERMNTVTSKANLSSNNKFLIPDLKVGTLDALVGLSDELGKLDSFAESVIKKIAQYIGEVMEDSKDKVQENLLANGGLKNKMKCLKIDLISYLTRFEWDMAKYPIKQPLKNISEALAKQITQIETDLKSRTAAYNNIKGNLQSLERKTVGNLLTRTLADIVNKEDFVLNSEYLITLLVVVPKSNYAQWQKTYESLSDMVVPRSTKMIAEDPEGGLFTVTLFRKVMDDFKAKARENRFMVREFYFDEKELKCEKEEIMKLVSDKKQQYGPLLRWLKVNFSEAFVAWIHVKALRVFVESVLRYGLPVNFQAMLLQPSKKSVKRLRDVLNAVFKHLDEVAAASIMDMSMDIPGLQLSNQEYYPYVYFKIDLSLLDYS
ncbi:V-type proton ATPase subunit C 2 isoform X1 [Gopherus flavomarginatus]|uniref:V-type proton ATPase subunit C 2 isoform X1 n=1 Tax=Gopherus flavomarginatus TaxID=286002 RepID=UPI0021CC19A5|nr:V-type proton ATPase subunit C 2 isoform X1 [Gopherus flavomarginatus]